MHDNTMLLHRLIAEREIRLQEDPSLSTPPPPLTVDWDRVEGMMLGLAIGDALGNTSEGRHPRDRQREHGEIAHYLPNRYADGRTVGVPSDDSQMAFWTLDCALADGGLDPEHLAETYCSRQIFGIGSAVEAFREQYRRGVRPWYRCAPESAGNGALMRIPPVLIPHLRSQTAGLWADAALAATLTHNQGSSTAACVAWVSLLWNLLGMKETPEPVWWPRAYVSAARRLEGETVLAPRGGDYMDYRGPLWGFVERYLEPTYREGLSVREAGDRWYSAAFLLETVPCALYILMRYGHDPREAILRAVNDTWDNDTVAAIVGGAVGALHGKKALPEDWLRDLTGRTSADDDGHMQALLDSAALVYGPQAKSKAATQG